jgi:hypothetical protein
MAMRVDVDKLYLGDYQFTIELDTGSETGGNQLTVWCATKAAIETVSLKAFAFEALMQALLEPYGALLAGQFADELTRFYQPFETKIAEIQAPFLGKTGAQLRLSSQAKRLLRGVEHQKRQGLRQLERDFMRRELLELERNCFNWEQLEKVNRTFGEGRFLRSFYFGEANDKYMYNFCRKFALNESYREEVLSGRARWFKRNALFYRNILHMAQVEHRVGEKSAVSYDAWLYHLFLWIDRHCESIFSLPEYRRLQALDGPDEQDGSGCSHRFDEGIRPGVEVFEQIAGLSVITACQGVAGTVEFLGRILLPLSTHDAYAHILLEIPEQERISEILQHLQGVGTMNCEQWGREKLRLTSPAIGQNLAFCEEVLNLGKELRKAYK